MITLENIIKIAQKKLKKIQKKVKTNAFFGFFSVLLSTFAVQI
jgi:hypothetical protein